MKTALRHLRPGEILRAHNGPGGIHVECEKGRVWITQTGDPRDLLLRQGEQAATTGHGLALIEALGPASVRIAAR